MKLIGIKACYPSSDLFFVTAPALDMQEAADPRTVVNPGFIVFYETTRDAVGINDTFP